MSWEQRLKLLSCFFVRLTSRLSGLVKRISSYSNGFLARVDGENMILTMTLLAATTVAGATAPATHDQETSSPATATSSTPLSAHPPVPHFKPDQRPFYPVYALRHSETGIAYYQLFLDQKGAITGCQITKSSGSESLDHSTCFVVTQSFYFDPATDEQGHPVASTYNGRMKWAIPSR